MDTSEIRIGNYVEVKGETTVVEGICNNADEMKVRTLGGKIISIKPKDVSPIPLTGQLLIKCCEFDDDGHYVIGIDHYRHYLKVEDGYIVLLNKEKEALIHFWDIKSLHQLQNLYYALKGKEMEVVFD